MSRLLKTAQRSCFPWHVEQHRQISLSSSVPTLHTVLWVVSLWSLLFFFFFGLIVWTQLSGAVPTPWIGLWTCHSVTDVMVQDKYMYCYAPIEQCVCSHLNSHLNVSFCFWNFKKMVVFKRIVCWYLLKTEGMVNLTAQTYTLFVKTCKIMSR